MMLALLNPLFQTVEEPAAAANQALDLVERGKELLFTYGPSVVGALLTLIIGKWIAGLLQRLVRKVMIKREIDGTLVGFLSSLLYAVLMTLVVISAIGRLGVNTASFIAILGAAGLAVGFALQGSLSNFAAGVMLIIFRPFKTGDFVEAGGVTGKIDEVQIFNTKMLTPDNKRIIVPNSNITGGNITNYSAMETRRVDMVFGCDYGDDIKLAKEVLMKIVQKDERVLKDPAPVVALSALADSSINFVVRPWVKTADYWNVFWDTHEQVKLEFDAAGLSIPFPQRDVHMHQVA